MAKTTCSARPSFPKIGGLRKIHPVLCRSLVLRDVEVKDVWRNSPCPRFKDVIQQACSQAPNTPDGQKQLLLVLSHPVGQVSSLTKLRTTGKTEQKQSPCAKDAPSNQAKRCSIRKPGVRSSEFGCLSLENHGEFT